MERLRYNEDSGKLFWLPYEGRTALWNGRYAGCEAFTATDLRGYKHGQLDGRQLRAHRVVWALCKGEWPPHDIDHVDGNRTNNRLGNLRAVTRAENHRNRRTSSTNTSGVMGVSWNKRSRKWRAYIDLGAGYTELGAFAD
jgi:hypothetical protein